MRTIRLGSLRSASERLEGSLFILQDLVNLGAFYVRTCAIKISGLLRVSLCPSHGECGFFVLVTQKPPTLYALLKG